MVKVRRICDGSEFSSIAWRMATKKKIGRSAKLQRCENIECGWCGRLQSWNDEAP
jgi:hypothetical protein